MRLVSERSSRLPRNLLGWIRESGLILMVALGVVPVIAAGGGAFESLGGKPLVEALELLREQGLPIVFSSDIVDPSMRVGQGPRGDDLRSVLRQILEPHGLTVREGPGGVLLVVRQAGGTLRGRVISPQGHGIPGASVVVGDATKAAAHATADGEGRFSLGDLRQGRYEISVSAPGYLPRTVEGIRITRGRVTEIVLGLNASPSIITEVVVTPGRHGIANKPSAAGVTLGRQEISSRPAAADDPMAALALLPGVAVAADSSAPNIRGASGEDLSLIVDGLELYQPYHLLEYRSPFSVVDLESAARLEMMSGAFPVDYGDRFGGVVRIETGPPPDGSSLSATMGTVNSRFRYGAPLGGGRGSWWGAARLWYPDIVTDTIRLGDDNPDPNFSDLRLHAELRLGGKGVITVNALTVDDELEFTSEGSPDTVDYKARGRYVWSRLFTRWTENLHSETVLSLGRIDRDRHGLAFPGGGEEIPLEVRDRRSVLFYGLKQGVEWLASESNYLRGGIEYRWLSGNYDYMAGDFAAAPAEPAVPPATASASAEHLSPAGASLGAYLADRWGLTPNLALEAGLRWDRQTYARDSQFSPRLHLTWRAAERSMVKLAWGVFHQSQRIHELDVEDGQTSFSPAQNSHQIDLSWQRVGEGGLSLRFGVYRKWFSDLRTRYENLFDPLALFPEAAGDRIAIEASRARAWGLETSLGMGSRRGLGWEVNYTYSRVEDWEGGAWVPRSWDQRHAVTANLSLRPSPRFGLDLSGQYHSGWPTTPVFGGGGASGVRVGPRNSRRLPVFWQIDARGEIVFPRRRGRMRLELNLLNLTNRKNACCVEEFLFDDGAPAPGEGKPRYGHFRGFMPSLSVVWER